MNLRRTRSLRRALEDVRSKARCARRARVRSTISFQIATTRWLTARCHAARSRLRASTSAMASNNSPSHARVARAVPSTPATCHTPLVRAECREAARTPLLNPSPPEVDIGTRCGTLPEVLPPTHCPCTAR